MYNLNRIGPNRPMCNSNGSNSRRQFFHCSVLAPPAQDMPLKPEYLCSSSGSNVYFRLLNNLRLPPLINDKTFVDINNRANGSASQVSYVVPSSYRTSYRDCHDSHHGQDEKPAVEEVKMDCGKEESQINAIKQPKKMKRNGATGDKSAQRSKKARKQKNHHRKSSKRESDRNVCKAGRATSRKQPKNGCKPWHKQSLKMEIDEACPSTPVTVESPVVAAAGICFQLSSSPPLLPTIEISTIGIVQQKNDSKGSECSPPLLRQQQVNGFRTRLPSECESEDSFIVFEDGDSSEESFENDSEESSDEDDSAVGGCCASPITEEEDGNVIKRVSFAIGKDLCEVHPMVKWSFAYQSARKGPWEEYARDRARFQKRISDMEPTLNHILEPSHRGKIYRERFRSQDRQ